MKKFLKIGFICSLALLLGIGIFLPTRVNSQYASAYNKPQVNTDYTYGDTWESMTWNGFYGFDAQYIWTDGVDIYYSNSTTQYVLDVATYTWSTMTWTGLTSFRGDRIWSDGSNIFYSSSSVQYILDVTTHTWTSIHWNSSFRGDRVWTDGVNFYYSATTTQYIIDSSNYLISAMSWNGFSSLNGQDVWTDGVDIYYSNGSTHYVLDVSTHTWSIINLGVYNFTGRNVWTDGVNIYCSVDLNNQYIFDISTHTWSTFSWSSSSFPIVGYSIWTDGVNIYYNDPSFRLVLYGTYSGGSEDIPDSDVVPNYPYIMPTIMEAFIGGFTGCFDFLGTAIADNFSDLFLEENINTNQLGLSVFGTLVFSFIGLCIALKVFKFIVKFIIRKGDAKYEKE